MVSHPETGSDSPIGSDRESGRDNDNSEDGWLDFFLLEEEGYWATVWR